MLKKSVPFHRLFYLLPILSFLLLYPLPTHATEDTPIDPTRDDYPLPASLSLCGEPVPLDNRHVWEMLDREFTISVWDRAQVFMWLKRANRYFPYIEKKLSEAGMPDDLKYLALAESALIGYIRSNAGAKGYWQFMTRTARRNGLRKNRMVDERMSFEHSTAAALKYLKRLNEMFESWTLAMAAYNCGETRLKREIKEQRVTDYYRLNLPIETERYVYRISAIKIIMKNPARYGFKMPAERAYKPREFDTVAIHTKIAIHLTDLAEVLGTDFKMLKELNSQILGYYLPTGRFTLKVPKGLGEKVPAAIKQVSPTVKHPQTGPYYRVKPGDTLHRISKKTGVSISRLRNLNGIEGSLIKVGQNLKLHP